MMRKMGWIILAMLGLHACSDKKIAGNPNTSETENVITSQIIDKQGMPVARQSVDLILLSTWAGLISQNETPITRTIQTNEKGILDFHYPQGEVWGILIRDSLYGLYRRTDQSLDSVWSLEPLQSHAGVLQGNLPGGLEICLEATDYCAKVNEGQFIFPNIPPGVYTATVRDSFLPTPRVVPYAVNVHLAAAIDSLFYANSELALEDFEDGNAKGLLAPWHSSGAWWIYQVTSTSEPATTGQFSTGIQQEDSKVFRLQVTVTDTVDKSLVLLGLNLGQGHLATDSNYSFANISEATSLCFRVKGQGSVLIFLQALATLRLGDDQHLFQQVTLQGEWQDVCLAMEDFVPFPNSLADLHQYTFASIANRVSAIVFQFDQSGVYAIDDLSLQGVSLLQLHGSASE